MKILAIDPATTTGWAHSDGLSGTWDFHVKRDESSDMRLVRLRGKLNELLQSCSIDIVVFEAARNAAPKMQGALVVHAEFQATIKVWCQDSSIQYRGYSPTEIKRHATGKGNASKSDMMAAAVSRWQRPIIDDNEADALWLLDLATSEFNQGVSQ